MQSHRRAHRCPMQSKEPQVPVSMGAMIIAGDLLTEHFYPPLSRRDVEFDLENDSHRCLHNLMDSNIFLTSDVRRVPAIFENPVFYSGTPKSAEIVQGAVEDCYLVSALSTMTSVDRLIKNLCVAVCMIHWYHSYLG